MFRSFFILSKFYNFLHVDLALFLLAYSQGINFKTYGATGNKFFKFLFFFSTEKRI